MARSGIAKRTWVGLDTWIFFARWESRHILEVNLLTDGISSGCHIVHWHWICWKRWNCNENDWKCKHVTQLTTRHLQTTTCRRTPTPPRPYKSHVWMEQVGCNRRCLHETLLRTGTSYVMQTRATPLCSCELVIDCHDNHACQHDCSKYELVTWQHHATQILTMVLTFWWNVFFIYFWTDSTLFTSKWAKRFSNNQN